MWASTNTYRMKQTSSSSVLTPFCAFSCWLKTYFWRSFARFSLVSLEQNFVQRVLEYVVLSVSPTASIPKKKLLYQTKNSFCTIWHLCIYAGFCCCCCSFQIGHQVNQLIWRKKSELFDVSILDGYTFTHTQKWPFISFFSDQKLSCFNRVAPT